MRRLDSQFARAGSIFSSLAVHRDQETLRLQKTVHSKMSGEEVSVYFKKTSQYLIQYLNRCSFEGSTGANMNIMMRLNLASDLLYVIRHTENKAKPGSLAIYELI
jgi:hypothetical protein